MCSALAHNAKENKIRGKATGLPAHIIRPLESKGQGLLATTYMAHLPANQKEPQIKQESTGSSINSSRPTGQQIPGTLATNDIANWPKKQHTGHKTQHTCHRGARGEEQQIWGNG